MASAMVVVVHTVVETLRFLRDAKLAGPDDDERRARCGRACSQPRASDEVRGSGRVRKVRVAGRGKGKSGGYRVMVVWPTTSRPVS